MIEATAHIVRYSGSYIDAPQETVQSPDAPGSGDPRRKGSRVSGRVYVGPIDCPDCTGGLSSRGTDFICTMLPDDCPLEGDEGDIVACGLTPDQRRQLIAESLAAGEPELVPA